MPNLRNLQLAPLDDEDVFEELCLTLWKRILKDPNTARNGRRGQRQHGVDLFGRRDESLKWVGIQCKVRSQGCLSKEDVLTDVNSAKAFNPRLTQLTFATTAPRDATLQEYVRELTEANLPEGWFSVSISFWDDIREEISKEENLDLCYRFFEGAMINYENLGIAVSRVIRLTLSVAGKRDSTYELLLGRTPCPNTDTGGPIEWAGTNYWGGHHFIASWNDKTIDTFPIPTFASDLERVFRSKRDAYIVAKWLTENESKFTHLIYGNTAEYFCDVSSEEFQEFIASLSDPDESD